MPDLVQYYLVDASLGMRKGKIAAQCAHGALLAQEIYNQLKITQDRNGSPINMDSIRTYREWFNGEMAKIVLKASPEIMDQAMKEFGHLATVVIDNGHTEVPANTRTVVVLPLMLKKDSPQWLQNLSLL